MEYGSASNPAHLTAANIHFTLIGWIILLAILYGVNRTKTGHVFIFYGLILIAVLLFVSNYRRIVPKLVTIPQGGATI